MRINWTYVLILLPTLVATGVALRGRGRTRGSRIKRFVLTFIGFSVTAPIILVVGAVVYVSVAEWWTSASVRYRLTVVAQTDGQEHKGSGVIEVTCAGWLFNFEGVPGGQPCQASGEAIPVDLGSRGILFVTLHGQQISSDIGAGPAYLPWAAFPEEGKDAQGRRTYAGELRALEYDRPKTDLAFGLLPLLVRFGDIKDPTSVEKVDPDHLDESFGPGVKLVKATIAITDDWVTGGISKVLPWVDTQKGALDGTLLGRFSNDVSANLSSLDFKPGTNQ